MSSRYLLCRPRGGLNDTLCQLEQCWRYAKQFNRHLIIDTTRSSLFGDFDDFFEFIDKDIEVTTRLDSSMVEQLNALSCRPHVLEGRIESYLTRFEKNVGHVETGSGLPSRFDSRVQMFNADYEEPLLVHEDSGGGEFSFNFARRIRLSPSIASTVQNAIKQLQYPYSAVHVRNTDYRTDYKKLFVKIKDKVGKEPLLVCSDDPKVISDATSFFHGEILSFAGRPTSNDPSGALHRANSFHENETRRNTVVDSIVDLVALARSRHLYITPVKGQVDQGKLKQTGQVHLRRLPAFLMSGYSKLAYYLHGNKEIVDQWLHADPEGHGNGVSGSVTIVNTQSLHERLLVRVRRLFTHFRASL